MPAVVDAGTDSGDLYLVMQLIAGHDLAAVIAERSPLPVPWAVAIAAQITTVLGRHAAELVEQGRFTQASELLCDALARADTPAETGPLRLDLASALLLGGDYRRALALYQQLAGDLSESATADAELVAHCCFQAALCQVEIGELTAALDGFRSLLADEQRRLDELDPELFELRRQIGVLMASTGDVGAALAELEDLRGDLEGVLGRDDPEVHDLGTIIDRLRSLTE